MPEAYVSTAPHELGAHLGYLEHDLSPYWALKKRVDEEDGGGPIGEIQHDGETYEVTLGYDDSGFKPRPSDSIDEVKEYRLHLTNVELPEEGADFKVSPRWPDMETVDGARDYSGPDILGVSVQASGSNLEPHKYPRLLKKAARCAGLNPSYFAGEPDDTYSSVYDFARYLRVDKAQAGRIRGETGTLRRIRETVAETGYAKHVVDDREDRGSYHTVTMTDDGASRLLDGHRYAREIKVYDALHGDADNTPDALEHPKLEVSLQKSKSNRYLPWSDVDELSRELDETVLNVLHWSGLPVTSCGYYIDDTYHSFPDRQRARMVIEDPTPEIRDEDEAIMLRHLRELNESDYDVLQQLVEDGGRVEVDTLDDELPWHLATLYRAIDGMQGLVELNDGEVKVASQHLAGKLNDAVQRAERALEDTARQVEHLAEMSQDELERRSSAFVQWAKQHGVEVENPEDARMQVRIQTNVKDMNERDRILERGARAWAQIGRDARAFKNAVFEFKLQGTHTVKKGL